MCHMCLFHTFFHLFRGLLLPSITLPFLGASVQNMTQQKNLTVPTATSLQLKSQLDFPVHPTVAAANSASRPSGLSDFPMGAAIYR